MNPYENFIAALTIFNKYEHSKFLSAEHDEIFAGPPFAAVSAEDLAELERLGWRQDDYGESFSKFV